MTAVTGTTPQALALPGGDDSPASTTSAAVPSRRPARRAVSYLLTVALLVCLNFALPRILPGDPITAMTATAATSGVVAESDNASSRAQLERYYGLDRPLVSQFSGYLADLARGDLGMSIKHRVPVRDLLADRLPWSLLLMGASIGLATVAGMVGGIHSGWRAGRRRPARLLWLFVTLREVPSFFLATAVLLVFAVSLDWFPLGGATGVGHSGMGAVLDGARHLALPATVLAAQLLASTYLVMRAGMVQELGSGYLLLGRAKGLSEHRLKYAYAARNALLPVVTLTALQLGFAVTGSIFIETVFAYPGIGRLTSEALTARDYPVLQGAFLVLTFTVVTANLVADLVYARLDPRVES